MYYYVYFNISICIIIYLCAYSMYYMCVLLLLGCQSLRSTRPLRTGAPSPASPACSNLAAASLKSLIHICIYIYIYIERERERTLIIIIYIYNTYNYNIDITISYLLLLLMFVRWGAMVSGRLAPTASPDQEENWEVLLGMRLLGTTFLCGY